MEIKILFNLGDEIIVENKKHKIRSIVYQNIANESVFIEYELNKFVEQNTLLETNDKTCDKTFEVKYSLDQEIFFKDYLNKYSGRISCIEFLENDNVVYYAYDKDKQMKARLCEDEIFVDEKGFEDLQKRKKIDKYKDCIINLKQQIRQFEKEIERLQKELDQNA